MAETKVHTCPICKLNDKRIIRDQLGILQLRVKCPRCKEFVILDSVAFDEPNSRFGPKVSAWIREYNERSGEVPQITPETLNELQTILPDYSPREKQIKLLRNIERKTGFPGQRVVLNYNDDFPLAWASGYEEFFYYISSLRDRGLFGADMAMGQCDVTITADGWDYLEQLERHIEDRTQAFVAMSFSEDLKSIWEGPIYRAIKKAGYKPYRVDAEPHSDRIDAKIIAEIKNSRFVVADVTEQKLGVYFEAGYAIGLGLPVLWCVREDELEKVHFDTRQYNHIVWETADDLETQLYDFICAIIGKGKEA
jgi:nucleoside 2-deoxyribosyltransferase